MTFLQRKAKRLELLKKYKNQLFVGSFFTYISFLDFVCYNDNIWGDTMLEIILGCVVLIALLGIVIIIYHNKFKISIVKIEEAENNIDLFFQKKLELLRRASKVIRKELKTEDFLDQLDTDLVPELSHFELNELLTKSYNEFFKVLDDNEKLFKSEALVQIIEELNNNEIDLVAAIKFYNDNVVTFNQLIVSFPSNVFRLFFGYKKKEFYTHEKREIYEILKDN